MWSSYCASVSGPKSSTCALPRMFMPAPWITRIFGIQSSFRTWAPKHGVPTGIRTPVTAVKGRCPRPLDDGDCESVGGGNRDRTGDLLHAMQALSQLSYTQ